jgi:isopentenyl phosphate kinase
MKSHFKFTLLSLIFLFCAILVKSDKDNSFTLIKKEEFSINQCVPYAYGDFNADKRIDIFCVTPTDDIEVWLAQEKKPLFSKSTVLKLK